MWNGCFADHAKKMKDEGKAEGAASTASEYLQKYLRGRSGDASEPLVTMPKNVSDRKTLDRIADSAFRIDNLAEMETLIAACR